MPIFIGSGLLAVIGFISNQMQAEPVYLRGNLEEIPKTIGEWKGIDVKVLNNRMDNYNASTNLSEPDNILKREYRDRDGNLIKLFIAHYESQEQGKEVVSYQYDWLYDNAVG